MHKAQSHGAQVKEELTFKCHIANFDVSYCKRQGQTFRKMLHDTARWCTLQPATYSKMLQKATCNVQAAAYNLQHTARCCRILHDSIPYDSILQDSGCLHCLAPKHCMIACLAPTHRIIACFAAKEWTIPFLCSFATILANTFRIPSHTKTDTPTQTQAQTQTQTHFSYALTFCHYHCHIRTATATGADTKTHRHGNKDKDRDKD